MAGKGPILVGGLDRSGKTTLRAFLQSHPRISIPASGSNMWTYFFGQYGDLEDADNFESCLGDMLRYKQVLLLDPDPDRIRREFWQGERTYARLFALFQQQHAEREGKPRWGVQTGLVERYADEVFRAYPNAQMVHMIRDPRDRYAGSLELWPGGRARAGGAAARWLYTTALARRNLARYPGQYRIVKFEDMVLNTKDTIRGVCDFLEEEYYPEMLDMPGAPEHRDKLIRRSHGDPDKPPLSPQYIGIYRTQVPMQEVAFIESLGRRGLKRHGYALGPVHFSPPGRAKYLLLTWPLNLARLVAWMAVEYFQHNFPRYLGRNPGSNMIVKPAALRGMPRRKRNGILE